MKSIENVNNDQLEIKEPLFLNSATHKCTKVTRDSTKENLVVKEVDYISLKARVDSLVNGVQDVREALSSQEFHRSYLNSLYYVLDQIQKFRDKIETSCLPDSDKNRTIGELNKYKNTLRKLSNIYLSTRYREVCLKDLSGKLVVKVPIELFRQLDSQNSSLTQLLSGLEKLLQKEFASDNSQFLKSNLELLSVKQADPGLFFISYKDLEKENVVRLLK